MTDRHLPPAAYAGARGDSARNRRGQRCRALLLVATLGIPAGATTEPPVADPGSSPEMAAMTFTVDSGGELSTGDGLALLGAFGQPDAGEAMGVGTGLLLVGGFWTPQSSAASIFDDGFESGDTTTWSETTP